MKRREFIALLGGIAIAHPLPAWAQQQGRMRRVGVLNNFEESDAEAKAWFAAFEDGLQQLGWNLGRNLRVDYRWAGINQVLLRTYAAELVGVAPDIIFVAATPCLIALHEQTRSLPIVFVQVSDPVKLRLVADLANPGGNITGFVNFEHSIGGKWLELIKDTAPGTSRVAVLFDPQNLAMVPYVDAIKAAAPSFGIELTLAEVRIADEIDRAMVSFARQPRFTRIACSRVAVDLFLMASIWAANIDKRHPMSIAYSKVRSRAICRFSFRLSTS
jgi:putative ABC transport system substrate-binding protein